MVSLFLGKNLTSILYTYNINLYEIEDSPAKKMLVLYFVSNITVKNFIFMVDNLYGEHQISLLPASEKSTHLVFVGKYLGH